MNKRVEDYLKRVAEYTSLRTENKEEEKVSPKEEDVQANYASKIAVFNRLQSDCDRLNRIRVKNGKIVNMGRYCEKCNYNGWMFEVIENEMGLYLTGKKCDCLLKEEAENVAKSSTLPENLKQVTFDDYKVNSEWQRIVKEKAEDFANSNSRMFFIGGQSGAGKTLITSIVARKKMVEDGIATYYFNWNQQIKELVAMQYDNQAQYNDRIKRICNMPLLAIDDFLKPFGKDKAITSSQLSIAYDIINYRYNKDNLTTIISSELTLNDVKAYDSAIAGRINEIAGEYVINLTNEDKNMRWK